MKRYLEIILSLALISFAGCTGGGNSSDYFAPGYSITPPTLVAAEGNVRGAITAIESYNFGTQTTAVDAVFTVQNSGELAARILDARFGGNQFSFAGGTFPGTGGDCSLTIQPGQFCTIKVRYTPTSGTSISSLMTIEYEGREGVSSLDVRMNGTGASAPSISSITPTSGLPAGGTSIIIQGNNFQSGATVSVGGGQCSSVSLVSSTRLTCLTPSHTSGTVDIVVTNPDSQIAIYSSGFTYRAAPSLANISNQTVNENVAITQVNANDDGDDFDADGEAITYTCFYDTNIDGSVAASTTCASLSGISFAAATGVMNWTPSYSQSGNYEFMITGSDGSLSDYKIFSIVVSNVNRAPSLDAITNRTVNEGVSLNSIGGFVDANDGGDDRDADGDVVTYTCYYDTTVDGSVANVLSCDPRMYFHSGLGQYDWSPGYSDSGDYEIKITGSDGSLSDSRIFTVTVNNVNRAPSLAAIGNQSVNENAAITQVNAADTNTANDTDIDGDTISYTCYYDTTIDGAVAASTTCASLSGVSFTALTGVINWTPSYSQSGSYEFKIIGSDGSLSDSKIFTITVTNVNRSPSLSAISNKTATVGVAMTAIDADDGGGDSDVDGDAITYTCYYDTTVDGAVATSTTCDSLAGATFTAATGIFQWTPASANTYELKITGSDGSLSDNKIFTITVSVASAWTETKLTASDGVANERYGWSVAASGTTVITGVYTGDSDRGSAYIYQLDPSSDTWAETKLTASDRAVGDYFGTTVGISGTTAIVGAEGDDGNAGSAYIYQLDPSSNTWAETKLTASDRAINNLFGRGVSISGTTAIVGAYGNASNRGAAYLYQLDPSNNSWMETKLTASDGVAGNQFGRSVGISGTRAIVGSFENNSYTGAAYIYQFDPSLNTWNETKITASDGATNDQFGLVVGISGTTAIMSTNKRSAYIYRLDPSSNSWVETQLIASDDASGSSFGQRVAISGNMAAVSASGVSSNTGAVYFYEFDPSSNNWAETKITPSDTAGTDAFGASVAISNQLIYVGAPEASSFRGATYLFKRTIPSSEKRLLASDGAGNDVFGNSVAISENTAIVGAHGDADSTGAAYVFQYDPSTSTWMETKLTASDGAINHFFGFSVSISCDTAIVGSWNSNSTKGSAYVFRHDPSSNLWSETKLTASDGAANDSFGYAVGISDGIAIVGAPEILGIGGAAYIYRLDPSSNTWAETKITSSDNSGGDGFGYAVAISDTTAVVGIKWKSAGAGFAYIYRLDPSSGAWAETKLSASDGHSANQFGTRVAIYGTTALIGAYYDNSGPGAAYLYSYDPSSQTWMETKLTASDAGADDRFGLSVAISETTAMVGATQADSYRGKAYRYRFDPSSNSWRETILTASDRAANDNFGASVGISGTTSIVGAYGVSSNRGTAYLYGF